MAAKRKTTALAPRRRSNSGTFRRVQRSSGPSPKAIRNRSRTRMLTLGGATAAAFGLLQSKLNLPSIQGIPDSLTYGAGALAVGLITDSETLMNCATGPFFAGLHNVALNGVGSTAVGYDDGDEMAGEFDEIAGVESSDFADL